MSELAAVLIDLDPGIQVGYPDLFPEQRLAGARLGRLRCFGELDR